MPANDFTSRPTAADIRPPIDMAAPCKVCGAIVEGTDGIWTWWDQHLNFHQWLWDQLNP